MRNAFRTITASLALLMVLSVTGCAKSVPSESQSKSEKAATADEQSPVTDQAFAQASQEEEERAPSSFDEKPQVGTRAYCLVMETNFTVSAGTPHSEYKGKHYVFCCPPCKQKFDEDPEKYI